jgi:hypothetical protein
MTLADRQRLIARIGQLRRPVVVRERPGTDPGDPQPDRVAALEARVAHLEQMLQGLQDSVHRESERQDNLIAKLRTQIEPGTMGAALAEDARNRGL